MRSNNFFSFNVVKTKIARTLDLLFSLEETYIVWQILNNSACEKTMIDVGAQFGRSLRPFLETGWEVHAFEPDSDNRNRLVSRYGSNPGLHVDSRAVSDACADSVSLFSSPESRGISSLSPFVESHRPKEVVSVVTLESYMEENSIHSVGFLKIDAEGYDFHVLRGFPWDITAPAVIMCEFEDSKTLSLGYSHIDLANFLSSKGYTILVSEWFPVVSYGSGHQWKTIAKWPHQVAAKASWGNLIAVKDLRTHDSLYSLFKKVSFIWRNHRFFHRFLPVL